MSFVKNIENWWSWKMTYFWIGHFENFSKKKILHPMKISHKLCVRIDGTQFLILWWFTARNESGNHKWACVYMAFEGQRRLKKCKFAKLSCRALPREKPKQSTGNCIHVQPGLRQITNCLTIKYRDVFRFLNPGRDATGAARSAKPVKSPIMAAHRCCCRRLLFFKIEVRPRSCRSYHIWRPCTKA